MKKKIHIYLSFIPTLVFLSYLIFGSGPVLGAAAAINQPLHDLEKNGAWGKPQTLDLLPILPEESRQILNTEILDSGLADLEVEVGTNPSTLWVDTPFTYFITVTNLGTEPALIVTLTDTLDASLNLSPPLPSQGSCSEAYDMVCSLDDIEPDGIVTVTMVVTPTAAGTITNTAVVTSTTEIPLSENNLFTLTSTVHPVADLVVSVDKDTETLWTNTPFTYTLLVTNLGLDTAEGVTLTNTLEGPLDFGIPSASQGWCSQTNPFICDLLDLDSGASATVTLVVTPTAVGTITNTAQITSTIYDPISGNNTDQLVSNVDPSTDLEVDLSTDVETILNNTPFTYTLLVTNLGLDTAEGVTLTDTLEGSLDFGIPSASQGWCSETNPFICDLEDLAGGASATVTLVVTPTAVGTITNTAQITSTTDDPDYDNNTKEKVSTVDPVADLYVSKTHQPDVLFAGQIIRYKIIVGNSGPDDAAGVVLTDTLPANLTFDSVSPEDKCTKETGSTVICDLGTITNTQVTVDILAVTTVGDTLTNTVEVSTTTAELSLDNNEDSDTAEVISMADLEVTKRAQPSEVSALSTFTYTVEVINHGPDIADGVTLTDTLPSEGITILGSQIDIGTCEGSSQIVCDLDELGVDETATLQVRVLAETMGTLTNEAAVSSTIADTNSENDYDSLEITVDPSADLVLTKTHQPETVYASTLFTYTLEVTNQGPYSATGIVLTDWLPPEVDLVDPGDCSGTDTVTCEKTDLLVGEHWEVTLVVRATQGVPLTNEASVWSETADPDPESNTVSYLTTIIPTADLDISKTASDGPVYLEEPLTYTVTITNLGPDPAEGVTLTDTLEGSFDLDILTASQGGCSETNPFICNLGDLLLGDSVTVTLVVTPTALGTITNTAVASSTTLDLIDGNNTNQVSDIVIPNADLSITKTSNADHVLVEDPITYTLTVTNHGPSIATDVSLVDTLPPGLTYTGHTPAEYDCTHDGSVTFSCNFPVMNPGESVQVTIHMFAPVDGAFTNSATVSSPVGESDLDNNTDSKETIVDPVAALEVAKTHKPSVIYAGQIILYEITVENSGPDDAEGVILTDDLPPGLDVDWVDPSQGQCTQDAPVECDLGTITTGTIVSVDIAARTDAAITLVNTVEVTTITADRDLENNEATDTTQVIPAADLSLTKTAEPVFVYTSNPLTYTLTVENLGPEPAVGVILTDTLPAGVTYQDLDISPGGGDDCDWSEVTNQVVCELGDIDEKDPTTTLTIWVTADEAGTLTNRAVVASSTYDTKMDNNTKTVDTEVYLPADLEVTQVGTPDTLNAQELLTYTITITNTGPAEATNATLVDDLDPLVAFESAPLGCTHVDQQVTCALGDLPEGGSTTLNITARTIITSTGGTISNTVTVSSDPWDPDTLDNTAVVTNTFLSDTQTPTGEWLLPVSYGEQWDVKGEIITLAITATDNIAIDYVKFYNIEHWDPNTPEDNVPRDVAILEEPPYELRFGTLSLAPGWNQMNLEVWDTAGNYFPDPSYDPRVYFIWLKFTPPEGYTKVYLPIALK